MPLSKIIQPTVKDCQMFHKIKCFYIVKHHQIVFAPFKHLFLNDLQLSNDWPFRYESFGCRNLLRHICPTPPCFYTAIMLSEP